VINEGSKLKEPWNKCTEDDSPIFSYTSGTTGDSKGVKLTHKNLISACREMIPVLRLSQEESHISYLPYPHSFEQCVTFFSVMAGSRIGYFTGDPTKLPDDCAVLKPSLFPSVPRLYNRIYAKIKGGIETAGGCKGWLA